MIHVVVGILSNSQNEVLVAKRAQHKFQGGRWEFPGGKVELDETPLIALQRELHEEIGIKVISATPLEQFKHAYPDKIILLDVWRIDTFEGEPHGKEGQSIRWVHPEELNNLEIPDANWEIVRKLF